MTRSGRYPPELRERAIRLVREHRAEHPSEWAAIQAIAKALPRGSVLVVLPEHDGPSRQAMEALSRCLRAEGIDVMTLPAARFCQSASSA